MFIEASFLLIEMKQLFIISHIFRGIRIPFKAVNIILNHYYPITMFIKDIGYKNVIVASRWTKVPGNLAAGPIHKRVFSEVRRNKEVCVVTGFFNHAS